MLMKQCICRKNIKRVGILVWALDSGGMERVASQLSLMLAENGYEIYLFVVHHNRNKSYSFAGKLVVCPCVIDTSSLSREVFSYLVNAAIIREMKQKYHIEAMISMAPEMNLINIFHNDEINIHHAQLIFNTHNPIFLNANLYRRDEIKFVERDDETHVSSHYALSDFKTAGERGVRKGEDYMKNYFISQYGAIKDIDFSSLLENVIISNNEEATPHG